MITEYSLKWLKVKKIESRWNAKVHRFYIFKTSLLDLLQSSQFEAKWGWEWGNCLPNGYRLKQGIFFHAGKMNEIQLISVSIWHCGFYPEYLCTWKPIGPFLRWAFLFTTCIYHSEVMVLRHVALTYPRTGDLLLVFVEHCFCQV